MAIWNADTNGVIAKNKTNPDQDNHIIGPYANKTNRRKKWNTFPHNMRKKPNDTHGNMRKAANNNKKTQKKQRRRKIQNTNRPSKTN